MASLTDASVPYGDAFTTVTSLIAQWLIARKKLESWLFWIANSHKILPRDQSAPFIDEIAPPVGFMPPW